MRRIAITAGTTLGVLALLVAEAVAGTPSPALADGLGGGIKSCTVLTRTEITGAFGQPAGKGSNDLGTTFCQWDLGITADRAAGQVNLLVERGKAATRDFRLIADSVEELEPVAGVGRKAFFAPATSTLFVLADGATFFYVQANLYADATRRVTKGVKKQLVQLATRAETRL